MAPLREGNILEAVIPGSSRDPGPLAPNLPLRVAARWLFLRLSTPFVMVFAPLIFYLAVVKPL
ncbi:MAG: hypothetical protein WBG82_13450 [Parvibaculum sp.]|uniref:hypothetical protein n=1 Tax=Parvibaculum sp. TaxID=2024848 RepID=UPI003C772D3B